MSRILLKNAMVCDADRWDEPLDVLTDGGVITGIAPGLPEEAADRVFDLRGYRLLPGVIDAHVHLIMGDIVYNDRSLKSWARAGVVMVRDLGIGDSRPLEDYLSWRAGVQNPECCEIRSAGKYVTAFGGRSHIMPDGAKTGIGCRSPQDVLNAVDYLLDYGFDGIKAMFGTRNGAGKLLPNLGLEEVRAMVRHCRERGVWLCCHVLETEFLPMLLEAGMPELAHVPTDNIIDDETIDRLVAAKVMITPTLIANAETPPPLPAGGIPPEMAELMKKMPPPDPELKKRQDATAVENIRRFFARGGRVALGTDTMRMESKPKPVGMPTGEMRQLFRAGLSVRDVITAATRNSADACYAGKELGGVAVGKKASLIAVKGELDGSFEALDHVEFVMNRGEVIQCAEPVEIK